MIFNETTIIYLSISLIVLGILLFLIIKSNKKKSKKILLKETPQNLKDVLSNTKNKIIGSVAVALKLRGKVDEKFIENLEETLIKADIGVSLTIEIIDKLKENIYKNKLEKLEDIENQLKNIILEIMKKDYENEKEIKAEDYSPFVCIFVGVNGTGKTTTIGKLSKKFTDKGLSVTLIAADTFRAAAIEQLEEWAKKSNSKLVKAGMENADPSSVVYDGIISAKAKKHDVILIDTAGRLQNKANLMKELDKIIKTIKKILPDAPHETLLVLDATTGQNGIVQAEVFNQTVKLSGIVLTKLDGTSKGGVILGIKHKLKIPVKFIGIGEKISDLKNFDAKEFTKALLDL